MEQKTVLKGFAIVIVDRGFIYVGNVEHDGEWCRMTNARNIRKWGTSKGLGQLAIEGPQVETVLDAVGSIQIPAHAVISIIDTEAPKWIKA